MTSSSLRTSCLVLLAALPAARGLAQVAPAQPSPVPAQASTNALRSRAAAQDSVAPSRDPAEVAIGGLTVELGGLTAAQAQERAIAASASLGIKRAELEAANAKIAQTTIQFFPQLTLHGSYTRISHVVTSFGGGASVGAVNAGPVTIGPCPSDPTLECPLDSQGMPLMAATSGFSYPEDSYSVGAGLAIPLSDYIFRVTDAAAGASASRDAARYAALAEELKVRTEARVLYYEWLRTHGTVHIAGKAVQSAEARLSDARAGFEVGSLSQADLMRIEALVANAEAAKKQAESGRNLVGAQLAIMMADAKGGDYRVGEAVPDLDAPDADVVSGRALIGEAMDKRLELRAIDAADEALRHGESALRVGQAPRLDAVADATYANPNQRHFPPAEKWNGSWSVGLVVSWNITDFFQTDARADEIVAHRAGVSSQRHGVEAAIANEVAMAQLGVNNAHAAMHAGDTSLRAAEESYRVTTDLFRVGRATTSDLIDAEAALLNARLSVFNAHVDLTIAVIRLEHALGRDAPAS